MPVESFDGLSFLDAMRPVILNAIDDFVRRGLAQNPPRLSSILRPIAPNCAQPAWPSPSTVTGMQEQSPDAAQRSRTRSVFRTVAIIRPAGIPQRAAPRLRPFTLKRSRPSMNSGSQVRSVKPSPIESATMSACAP